VSLYRRDLAWIHHQGFSEFAASAAPGVIALLHAHDIRDGLVIDVGCGSGVLAHALTDAGFDVLGIDASPDMIELARANAPNARFEAGSFAGTTFPPCEAIIAMGEVLNYGTLADVQRFIRNARHARLLLFDVAERGSYPLHDERRIGGDDWSVIVVKDSDGEHLTRRVLTFRELDGVTHRDDETHSLALHAREELLAILRENDFRVRVRRSYGSRRLPPAHTMYIAERRRPAG
jgi:SAM-dependent methyltransferase